MDGTPFGRYRVCVGAAVLAAGMLMVAAPGAATACACGGVVSPDTAARVSEEDALVSFMQTLTDGYMPSDGK